MSPRSSEEFEQIRKKRRESILEAALQLFAENGYRATSMSQIAKKANVAKGLIYNYFDGKEHLLEQILQAGFDSSMPDINKESSSKADPRVMFQDTLHLMSDSIKRHPHFWQLYARLFMQLYDTPSLSKQMEQFSSQYYEYLRTLLTNLNIPDVETEMYKLAAVLDGILLHYLAIDSFPLNDVLENIINEYLDKSNL